MKRRICCVGIAFALACALAACAGPSGTEGTGSSETVKKESSISAPESKESSAVEDVEKSSSSEQPEASSSAVSSEPEAVEEAGNFSLEELIGSEELQEGIKAMESAAQESGMDLTVTAEGNRVIYVYQYQQELPNREQAIAALEEILDSTASVFEGVASYIASITNVENPVVELRYLDMQGELLCAREFSVPAGE